MTLSFRNTAVSTNADYIWHQTKTKQYKLMQNVYYSTGVQIASCTLSSDSVPSESTGLFNSVLCFKQWKLSWQKNYPIRLCLSTHVKPGKKLFSLCTWGLLQAFWKPNFSIIQNMTLTYFKFFNYILNSINLAPKVEICTIALLVKSSWMQCPLHNKKVNKPGFHCAPSGIIKCGMKLLIHS